MTATLLSYLRICHRKLWLHGHGLRLENAHDNVGIGRLIQETSFSRKTKELVLGEIGKVDWIDLRDGIVHETKKGKTPNDADVLQVKYYMHWLRENGMQVKAAKIHYPKKKRTTDVPWDDAIPDEIKTALDEAQQILDQRCPPPFTPLPYCKSCAFHEFCCA